MENILDLEMAEKVPYKLGILKRAQIENGAEFGVRKMGKTKVENPKKNYRMMVRRECAKNKQNMIEAFCNTYMLSDEELEEEFVSLEEYDRAYAAFCTDEAE